MVRSYTLYFAAFAFGSRASDLNFETSDPAGACTLLKQTYPNITHLPEDEGYAKENEVSWTAAAWLSPACIFAPTSALDLSFAVRTFVNSSTPFAMRGGGHMPIADAANINETGVLISSTNLNTLSLSEDKQTMSIGPGPRWGDVFQHLNGTDLNVVGGRLAPVGVPGLLLGGGMSWYSYKHGLASAGGKIKAYEAVLADGCIVTVTANNTYSDLYWALGGGGNSFALITRFDLQTFPVVTPLMAEARYGTGENVRDAYLNAVLNFTLNGDEDTDAAIIPVARWGPNATSPTYDTTLFYNGTSAPTTGPFTSFTNNADLKALNGSSTLRPFPLAKYGALLAPAFKEGGESHGLRQKFRVVSAKASLEALRIVHDTFFASLAVSGIANRAPHFFAGLAFNCITRTYAEASAGLPQNIPIEPAFWVEEAITWRDESDDAEIEEWVRSVNEEIEKKLSEVGALGTYIYSNDADKGQKVFESYGEESVSKLKAIRAKYDEGRVFTDLMPGGFKVEYAEI
ncbi:putative FAD dependent oxidoreductase [Dendryphion nanum]|uniref:FAD dependent oxidoreductase n=1 Tax=Dendryphion nanum TaxID=256645 RepID=A0A9P9DNX9_9PLEO|nr:putative FAD dependent oxidoreductase [Dendryphion nanum]